MPACTRKSKKNKTLENTEVRCLNALTNILRDNKTKSRKIHFFVLEYAAEKKEYDNNLPLTYLNGAVDYIRSEGIFKNDTDAIFLMITKADQIKAKGEERKNFIKNYINKTYNGFYNRLKGLCEENEINKGEVNIIPFSIGEVCFQEYCLIDKQAAKGVVSLLLKHSKGYKKNKFSILKG